MSDVGGISGESECVPLSIALLALCVCCVCVCACVRECGPWGEDPKFKALLILYS